MSLCDAYCRHALQGKYVTVLAFLFFLFYTFFTAAVPLLENVMTTRPYGLSLYPLTTHNGYWANVMQKEMAAGRSAQRVCNDTFKAICMMGRGVKEAIQVTQQAAWFAGIPADEVKW